MSHKLRNIVAGSASLYHQDRRYRFSSVFNYAIKLTNIDKPRVCYVGTANGDSAEEINRFYRACSKSGIVATHLELFPMPNYTDMKKLILSQDLIWVSGGSSANLISLWKTHNLFPIFKKAWESGVVLGGNSAGSICWANAGLTDSFGLDIKPLLNDSSLLPYSSIVHYDNGVRRKQMARSLISSGKLPEAMATDDGVAVHYIDDEVYRSVSNLGNKHAYKISRTSNGNWKERVIKTE